MIDRIFVTEAARGYRYASEICDRAGIQPEYIPDDRAYRREVESYSSDPIGDGKKHLLLDVFKGDFFRKCPGTQGKICCNYYVIDQSTNCPFDCSYCFLQSYLNIRSICFAVNIEDLFEELSGVFQQHGFVRLGTGELSDSLALETLTHFGSKLLSFCGPYPNVILELKTKSDNVYDLPDVSGENFRAVIGWTLSPQAAIDNEERGTTSLVRRLDASKHVASKGYGVSFHLDPIIFSPGFESAYIDLVDQMFSFHDQLAWLSIAGFRYEPSLKFLVEKRFPDSQLLDGEFLRCSDGKYRYLFPDRMRFFRHLIKQIKARSPRTPVYFCMEDITTWDLAMGPGALKDPVLKSIFQGE